MYQLIANPYVAGEYAPMIKRLSDNTCIPTVSDNTDYQAFLKYQAEGGKVYGADEEIPEGNQPTPADEE